MVRINHSLGVFEVDSTGDPYGESFWKSVESRRYEPDTVGFLENHLSPATLFLDIGAANGAMTLIGALRESEVVSYEPDPTMFDILERNLAMNPKLGKNVRLMNVGISNSKGSLEFNSSADSSIFSSIVVGEKKSKGNLIPILSLAEEIERTYTDKKKKLVIKMDIEGAEWRILNDIRVLESLSKNKATLLLAVHPGFYRPHRKLIKGIDRISLTIWHLRNYLESLRTYKKIVNYGIISRTNLNPVRNSSIFAILVLGGYHEFVIDFQ